jgi:hypothetical protein
MNSSIRSCGAAEGPQDGDHARPYGCHASKISVELGRFKAISAYPGRIATLKRPLSLGYRDAACRASSGAYTPDDGECGDQPGSPSLPARPSGQTARRASHYEVPWVTSTVRPTPRRPGG